MLKMSDQEFRDYLTITSDADVIEDRLQTVASVYLNEAQYLVGVAAKLSQVQRDLKVRRAELYASYRSMKSTDKSLTEAAIEAQIQGEESVQALLEDAAKLELAVDLRKVRIDALKMMNGNLQLLGRSILNEKFGVT